MRGQEGVIAIRKAGKKPEIVFINDYPCQTNWLENSDHATVCTAGDSLSDMDFWFVVGLTVSISGTTEARAKALAEMCKAAGAEVVASCHVKPMQPWEQNGWSEIWRKNG